MRKILTFLTIISFSLLLIANIYAITSSKKSSDVKITAKSNDDGASILSIAKNKLVAEIDKVQSHLKYSRYVLGGEDFNLKRGIFIVDCSGYVSNLLKRAIPHAYDELTQFSHTKTPDALDYYNYIKYLAHGHHAKNWKPVKKVSQLKPGDVLIFRYRYMRRHISGHVMVIMSKPKKAKIRNAYIVRVSDSTPFHHSDDTRHWHSGVGEGTMMLKVNPKTGKPILYAWALNYGFSRKMLIDMGQPIAQKAMKANQVSSDSANEIAQDNSVDNNATDDSAETTLAKASSKDTFAYAASQFALT